jgi:hypothetical protein
LTEQQRHELQSIIENRNGTLRGQRPYYRCGLPRNTAAYIFDSVEAAKAAAHHLTKYMTKDATSLGQTLSFVHDAHEHIMRFPSQAPDSGERGRTCIHLFERIVNQA